MSEIIKEARNLYSRTVSSPSYEELPRSPIWDKKSGNYSYQKSLRERCQTPEEVLESLRGSDMYAITIQNPGLAETMMDWHLSSKMIERYPALSRFKSNVKMALTPNLCKMLCYCQYVNEHTLMLPERVLEIGGGNGQLFTVMNRLYKIYESGHKMFYADVDIPESLYCAYVCIRHWHPELNVLWVQDDTPVEAIEQVDVVLIPHHLRQKIKGMRFDLFVNTASLGEMPNETIRMWADFVQNQVSVDYLLCFNRFLNTVNSEDAGYRDTWSTVRMGENEASVCWDKNWQVLEWEVEPYFSRCPYEDPRIARYLMLVMKRSVNVQPPSLEKVKLEDWWRYRGVDATSTYRSCQLVHDLTMDGTLFKLWESMRLAPNPHTADMILTYLGHLMHPGGLSFEEEYFYRNQR